MIGPFGSGPTSTWSQLHHTAFHFWLSPPLSSSKATLPVCSAGPRRPRARIKERLVRVCAHRLVGDGAHAPAEEIARGSAHVEPRGLVSGDGSSDWKTNAAFPNTTDLTCGQQIDDAPQMSCRSGRETRIWNKISIQVNGSLIQDELFCLKILLRTKRTSQTD